MTSSVYPTSPVSGTPGAPPTMLGRIRRMAGKTIKPLKGAKSAGSIFRNVVSIAEHFRDLSKSLNIALHVSKGPNIILGLVSIKDAVKDVRKIIDKTQKSSERMRASLLFVTHLDSITNTAATVCKIWSALQWGLSL